MLHCMDQIILTSHYSPTGPVLRANPYPEVTDLICRLPLPTLFYRLEAVYLADLLRIWSSRISFEYLLLPPRSALMEAPIGPMPKVFNANHCETLTRCGQVSCYTFLSGFQLPWPPSCWSVYIEM
ncbi:1,3-beta-glucanosyltransferase PGA5 [Dirofilaria immitis]